jgi:hypothetical protein
MAAPERMMPSLAEKLKFRRPVNRGKNKIMAIKSKAKAPAPKKPVAKKKKK